MTPLFAHLGTDIGRHIPKTRNIIAQEELYFFYKKNKNIKYYE